jgi:hypothetical protein
MRTVTVCELCAGSVRLLTFGRRHSDLRPISHLSFNRLKYPGFDAVGVRQLCASVASQEETLWLVRLAKSSREATADGSSGIISAAITKLRRGHTPPPSEKLLHRWLDLLGWFVLRNREWRIERGLLHRRVPREFYPHFPSRAFRILTVAGVS